MINNVVNDKIIGFNGDVMIKKVRFENVIKMFFDKWVLLVFLNLIYSFFFVLNLYK